LSPPANWVLSYLAANHDRAVSGETDKGELEVSSVMQYLEQMDVNPENCEIFVLANIIKSPSFGAVARQGYVEGWKEIK
jgi:hypothetical protein